MTAALWRGHSARRATLPAGFQGTNACAEIEVHPNGRFLYATNRGHDSLAVFAIDAFTGKLTLIEHVPSQGRGLHAISPSIPRTTG